MKRWIRKLHRWGALITLIPLLLVIVTGLLLQIKKQVAWIQPVTLKGSGDSVSLGWDRILEVSRSVKEASVADWSDISRLDIRPGSGMIKVICANHWELQIDAMSGAVLSSSYRRSDWIEQLHDGSFFSETAKLFVFLPNGIIMLGLWLTGVYLWWLPIGVKRAKELKKSQMDRN
jgi:uncharacterized iron-regulated membrane protein